MEKRTVRNLFSFVLTLFQCHQTFTLVSDSISFLFPCQFMDNSVVEHFLHRLISILDDFRCQFVVVNIHTFILRNFK
jgi:hypothetical protein